ILAFASCVIKYQSQYNLPDAQHVAPPLMDKGTYLKHKISAFLAPLPYEMSYFLPNIAAIFFQSFDVIMTLTNLLFHNSSIYIKKLPSPTQLVARDESLISSRGTTQINECSMYSFAFTYNVRNPL